MVMLPNTDSLDTPCLDALDLRVLAHAQRSSKAQPLHKSCTAEVQGATDGQVSWGRTHGPQLPQSLQSRPPKKDPEQATFQKQSVLNLGCC